MKTTDNVTIRTSYPYPNGRPTVTITYDRNIKVKNEPMESLEKDVLYSAKNLPAQNDKKVVIKLEAGLNKSDGFKIVITPSYSFNGPFTQYLRGCRTSYPSYRETDEREKDVMDNITRALTSIHKLATKKDLAILKDAVSIAIPKMDKAKRKQ